MYQRYIESKGWKIKVRSCNSSKGGGIKEIVFEVPRAYKRLFNESGVHRVQRVSKTKSREIRHTSTATVAVLPLSEIENILINPDDLRIDVFRAKGHGGQRINKVETAVRIRHLPTGIVTTSQQERSQPQNKALAMEDLQRRLQERKLQDFRGKLQDSRKNQVGTGERSEKVRTYDYMRNQVIDHRTGFMTKDLKGVLNGNLDDIMDAYAPIV